MIPAEMKKSFSLLLLLALPMLLSAAVKPVKTVRLTLINKSGKDIEVSLTGAETEASYFFRVTEGSRRMPTEAGFDVVPDRYQVNAYFDEMWDPVYGASCEDRQQAVDVLHNTRVIIFECDVTPPNGGEAGKIKLGGTNTAKRGR